MIDNNITEQEFEFSLILSGVEDLTEEVENALFEAGCDDATLSIQHGAARLEFTRSAESFLTAVLSAIGDVCRAGHGIGVVQVDECNLVTQAEIGRRMDRSRQLVHQFITGERGPGHFPPPSCYINEMPLWRWCEVSFWLAANCMIKKEVVLEAQVISAVNNYLERQHLINRHRSLMTKVADSLGSACGCGS